VLRDSRRSRFLTSSFIELLHIDISVSGVGSGLFYASQGLGSVSGPFLAQTSRLALLVIVGWVAMPMIGLGLKGLFVANAATIAWVGVAIMLVFWRRSRELTLRSERGQGTLID
jgi:Na+-driven multidrug efflux pump